jgi:hypothetical protein
MPLVPHLRPEDLEVLRGMRSCLASLARRTCHAGVREGLKSAAAILKIVIFYLEE